MKNIQKMTPTAQLRLCFLVGLLLGSWGDAASATQLPLQIRSLDIALPDYTILGAELTLPGTFKPGQRLPLVILVHGSGANDMNETTTPAQAGVPGGSAVFLQLAQHLSGQGFAVLRYNKRGVLAVGPRTLPTTRMVGPTYTISGFAEDALKVLQFARTLPQVDTRNIFLLGHSEGTMVVSRIASRHPSLLRGVVTIGTVGETMRDSLHYQLVGEPLRLYREVFDRNHDGQVSIPELTQVARQRGMSAEDLSYVGLINTGKGWQFPTELKSDQQGNVRIEPDLRRYLERTFVPYPKLPIFSKQDQLYLKDAQRFGSVTQNLPGYLGPVLMLQGSDDPNTRLVGTQAALAAVKKAGNRQATLKVYAGLGHSLSPSRRGVATLGPIAKAPLNDLAQWIRHHLTDSAAQLESGEQDSKSLRTP